MDEENNKNNPAEPTNEDKYNLEPHPTPISEERANELMEQAKKFQQHYEEHKKNEFFGFDFYFILSKKWYVCSQAQV